MVLRILLADDHAIVRQGVRALLEKQRDYEIVGEVSSGRDAIGMSARLTPHIVVMDIAMPDLNGVEAAREIRKAENPPKVIALSMQSDGSVIRRMFQAGASAYLLKECLADELFVAIRTVMSGRVYLSPAIADTMVKQIAAEDPLPPALTPKEREVLQLIAEGKSTKEVANCLSLSVKTVDTHRQHIMDKLNIHNIAELTRYAIREKISFLES